jgi:hypothetical protein
MRSTARSEYALVIEAVASAPVRPKRSPVAATLGILSGALVMSTVLLRSETMWLAFAYKRLAKIGLAGGTVSIAALVVAGGVWAAGINPTGACGGG